MNIKIENLGEFLKEKRINKNLTIRYVACSTNLSPGYISRMENGSSRPSYETLLKLSKILSFNLNDVIDTSFDIDDTFDILEMLSTFNLHLNGKLLTEKEKKSISDIIKMIYEYNWDNDTEKVLGITRLFTMISEIKS